MKIKIGFDMDGVLADLVTEIIYKYNKKFSDNIITHKDFVEWGFDEYKAIKHPDVIWNFVGNLDYSYVMPMKRAVKVLEKLIIEGFDVYIITDAFSWPNTLKSRYEWLISHFSFMKNNFIFTKNKHLVDVDYLIDDNIDTINKFNEYKINKLKLGVIYDAPYNQEYKGCRFKNMDDVEKFFLNI